MKVASTTSPFRTGMDSLSTAVVPSVPTSSTFRVPGSVMVTDFSLA